MLNYELCAELKSKGFPQGAGLMIVPDGTIISHAGKGCYCPRCFDEYTREYAIVPSLEELIEACVGYGEPINLIVNPDGHSSIKIGDGRTPICKGESPSEAVARLWLELHK